MRRESSTGVSASFRVHRHCRHHLRRQSTLHGLGSPLHPLLPQRQWQPQPHRVLPLHVWIDAHILIAIARPVCDLLPQTEQLKELLSCNQAKDPLDLSLLVKILYVLLLQGLEDCVSCRP